MPVDEQSQTLLDMGERDNPGKSDTGTHVERVVSGNDLFEREETALGYTGRQTERIRRRG